MTTKKENIYSVLSKVQKELKAPKTQFNSFWNFYYRSLEDIFDGLKKVIPDWYVVRVEDEIVVVWDKLFIKATAIFTNWEEEVKNIAFAQLLSWAWKKMDEAQATGASSSYARKYALNGLFMIDDVKDPDTDEHNKLAWAWKWNNTKTNTKEEDNKPWINQEKIDKIEEYIKKGNEVKFADLYKKYKISKANKAKLEKIGVK